MLRRQLDWREEGMGMRFFDCNTYIGLPRRGELRPVKTAAELVAEMDRAGIERALVWHYTQRDWSVGEGNRMIAEAIAPHRERLVGTWCILPPQCEEIPPRKEFFTAMKKAGIGALRAFPAEHRWHPRREVIGELFDEISERGIPLIMSCDEHVHWPATLYDVMREFPTLTLVITDVGLWGPDRFFRPLVENYQNVYVEISQYILADGIKTFVKKYGAERLLFGTGFPRQDHGAMMLVVKHAEISEADKEKIAAGNMERILAEARL